MFVGIHAMLAMQTKTPELAISEQEGRDFMKSAQNVMRHYSVSATQKTIDWVSFLGIAGGIYGTRVFAISVRKQSEAATKPDALGQVLKFPDRGRRDPPPVNPAQPPAPAAPAYVPSVIPGDEGSEEFSGF